MNKMLTYTLLAILLGTVTMIAPLALLDQTDAINGGDYTIQANDTQTTSQDREVLGPPPEQENTDPKIVSNYGDNENADFSAIAWMTIPSFAVALAVFVYFKKQIN